jgi:hypothetical protein
MDKLAARDFLAIKNKKSCQVHLRKRKNDMGCTPHRRVAWRPELQFPPMFPPMPKTQKLQKSDTKREGRLDMAQIES